MILLGTNVISELRPGKREPSAQVRAWADQQPVDTLYLSALTVLELRLGMERKARVDAEQGRRLRLWIEGVEAEFEDRILPFRARTARHCAPLHVPDPCNLADSMIAATAMEHGLVLATRNVRDFVGFGLRLVNPWGDSP